MNKNNDYTSGRRMMRQRQRRCWWLKRQTLETGRNKWKRKNEETKKEKDKKSTKRIE